MEKKIRLSIIGAGEMGIERGTIAKVIPQYELVCVVDSNLAKARLVGNQLGVNWYTSFKRAAPKEAIDAVMISTPEETHAEVALEVLEQGMHVLCEKPLTVSWKDSRCLARKAQEAGVVHMVDYNCRYLPTYGKVKELIDGGVLGTIQYVRATGHDSVVLEREDEDLQRQREARYGMYGSYAVHNIDLLYWYVGQPRSICARTRRVFSPRVDDLVVVLCDFEGGVPGILDLGWSHFGIEKGTNREFMVTGDNGTVRVDDYRIELHLKEARGEYPEGETEQYAAEIPFHMAFGITSKNLSIGMEAFAKAVLEGTPCSPNWEDGFRVDEIVAAINRSAIENTVVSLPLEG
jgi:predicted dehydrogenase